ncbi:MAG TPA: hypothetical protein VM733_00200 [Thermoanaerobaculia bacterium]|nr:hypothetical protein [Thermoanaerobaculia bacterium]
MNDDWAIVVGIRSYWEPSLQGLEGPENDAREFYDWVISPDGGGVPEGQAKRILSSDFQGAQEPTATMVQAMFDHLDAVDAKFKKETRTRKPFGRRLWIYFSGHGFAPDIDDKLTALLTAEAALGAFHKSHVITSKLADYCATARYFTEVFMFADCCRTIMPVTQLNVKPIGKRSDDADEVRTFYAYGARIGKESREWEVNGQYRGVFTMTLMEGLRGAAVDRSEKTPVITAESLNNFLHNNFAAFMVPDDRGRAGIRREPEVQYEHRATKLVIAPLPETTFVNREGNATKYPVRILARTKGAEGEPYVITRRSMNIEGKVGDEIIDLEAGLYVVSVRSLFFVEAFEVTAGPGVVDVHV